MVASWSRLTAFLSIEGDEPYIIELVVFLGGINDMGILSWIFMGLIVGLLARWITPGEDKNKKGFIVTVVIGIAGAFVGGIIAAELGFGSITGLNLQSLLIATGGAILLLWVVRELRQ